MQQHIGDMLTAQEMTALAKERFAEERAVNHLHGWFLAKEIARECDRQFSADPDSIRIARTEVEVMKRIPLSISDHALFAGTMDDAFARSYALINPSFRVDSFSGYCDPTAVFGDIEPQGDITRERIDDLKKYNMHTQFADSLVKAYGPVETYTSEAVFFIEQVTGHLIPDVRPILAHGIGQVKQRIRENDRNTTDAGKHAYCQSMEIALDATSVLANRYAQLAHEKAMQAPDNQSRARFRLMEETLAKVPAGGADNLYEAIQSFLLVWQSLCLEQAPNPFAFSVGNADRIFEPYRAKEGLGRDITAALLKHFLVFFNVADRSWAISQNVLISGKSTDGGDLTNPTSYALLDAYYSMNLPQPILSVKLHKNTPHELYGELGRFFFTPGCLTPSLFNDDSLFPVLEKSGIEPCDLQDYAVAGCQEPLIMGKDNGNTTNSWLNMPKVLELTIQGGISEITGKKLGKSVREMGYADNTDLLRHIREAFYKNLEISVDKMTEAANNASRALALLQVPYLSSLMGGVESGIDARDPNRQGTKYNGSGCLIHGLSVIADSFVAIDTLLKERPQDVNRLIVALKTDFKDDEDLRQYALSCDKFGNNLAKVDDEAVKVANRVCDIVSSRKNYLGNPFRCDFSTPSTHLMYGYWVGATPDGRKARQMLNYGVDPLYGEAHNGLGFRMLSYRGLPFCRMNGGYASHLGIDPAYFKTKSPEEKGLEFKDKVITPLFFNDRSTGIQPFYLYVNVTTPEMLRKVLAEPKKYAPGGVYIVRIHGTFVNFLDLSPEIQEDIIRRLDPQSTRIAV